MSLFGKYRGKLAAGLAIVAALLLALSVGGCELIVGVPIAVIIAAVCDTCTNRYNPSNPSNLSYDYYEIWQEKAQKGDPKAQYMAAIYAPDPDERWVWMCRAAMQDHRSAQRLIANWYDSNVEHFQWHFPIQRPDNVKALVWYTLAVSNGHSDYLGEKDRVAASLTPDQVAEAERLVAEWKPDPAWCDRTASPDS